MNKLTNEEIIESLEQNYLIPQRKLKDPERYLVEKAIQLTEQREKEKVKKAIDETLKKREPRRKEGSNDGANFDDEVEFAEELKIKLEIQ